MKILNSTAQQMKVLVILLFLAGCSGSGNLAGDSAGSKVYDKGFDEMQKVVRQAIRGMNLTIRNSSMSDDGNQLNMTIIREQFMGDDEVQRDQGRVRIIRMEENKTRVEVENPEYHYSVPQHQRAEYRRVLFLQIKDMLKNNDA